MAFVAIFFTQKLILINLFNNLILGNYLLKLIKINKKINFLFIFLYKILIFINYF